MSIISDVLACLSRSASNAISHASSLISSASRHRHRPLQLRAELVLNRRPSTSAPTSAMAAATASWSHCSSASPLQSLQPRTSASIACFSTMTSSRPRHDPLCSSALTTPRSPSSTSGCVHVGDDSVRLRARSASSTPPGELLNLFPYSSIPHRHQTFDPDLVSAMNMSSSPRVPVS
jgi:hypothetical protein